MKQTVLVLGSTGSIGTQTLEVLEKHRDRFCLVGISAERDSDTLRKQAERFRPAYVACRKTADPMAYPDGTTLLCGEDASERLAAIGADIVVLAIAGFAALKPLLCAIGHTKRIAIANKESLVCGGQLVMDAIREHGVALLPIDSEQSALFQCLQNGKRSEVKRLILTASGGPFFGRAQEELQSVSLDEALTHPTWRMGKKITLDSATLFNKGLEVIEAARLFGFGADEIDVLIHPQSIVHSLVEYGDGSIIANLAVPDMRLPIQYAMTYPERTESLARPLDLASIGTLTFFAADPKRYLSLALAYAALKAEGGCPIVYNGANERAAELFFANRIGFSDIGRCVEAALNAYVPQRIESTEAVFEIDARARALVDAYVERNG